MPWPGVHCGGDGWKICLIFYISFLGWCFSFVHCQVCAVLLFSLTVTILMTQELLWVEDSGIFPCLLLYDVVLPYICKTFYDRRSTSIHVSSFNVVERQWVRPVLLASFYILGTWGLECLRYLLKVTKLGDDGDRTWTWTLCSFNCIIKRGMTVSFSLLFFHVLFWSPPAHTLQEVESDLN